MVKFREEAERELFEAVAWYDDDYPGRGRRFYLAVMNEAVRIQEAPRSFPLWRRRYEVRACVVPRFPFTLYFVIEPDGPMVYAVAHQKRRPGYWRKRLPSK